MKVTIPEITDKELMIIPDCVHTDLYDGGGKNAIPFDKIEAFLQRISEIRWR